MNVDRKRIRTAVAALLAGVLLLCALFIVAEGHHHCCGDECAVCACIRLCQRLLHPILDPGAISVRASALLSTLVLGALLPRALSAAKASPVLNKVRIND